jgi:hypothetical protein
MSFLSKLIGNSSEFPDLNNESAVVEWFLQHDEKVADLRRDFPSRLEEAREEILTDLRAHSARAASLQEQFTKISSFYFTQLLPTVVERRRHGGPRPDETVADYLDLMFMESVLAAKLRIFGYILLKKHGIDPTGAAAAPDEVRCWACKAVIEVTAENRGRKVKCRQCGTRQVMPT